MTDITDAGPRLRAMNDALEENARLTALVESLRREVREQRKEIAGLREERRAILEADRPQPDRLQAIETGESDRPKPIADARLAALEELSALDQKLELEYGLTGNPMIKGQQHTPQTQPTPGECTVLPEWTSKPYWVDPPSGHRYGFPRLYDPASDGDMTEWMIRNGYPERLARQGLPCTFTAMTEDGEK